MSSSKWEVVVEPRGNNDETAPGKNHGGMVIFLKKGSEKQEVSRVAFVRRNGANPKDSFKTRFKREHAKAVEAAELLNEAMSGAGSLA